MTDREWVDLGVTVEIPTNGATGRVDRIPDFDPRSGDHLWIWAAVFRANPARLEESGYTPLLDGESVLLIDGPGCYYCEETYSRRIASRRCPGKGKERIAT